MSGDALALAGVRKVFKQGGAELAVLNGIDLELRAGELVMFDNCRLLHGRTGFDVADGLRHLQGCYIDMDGPRILYRMLRRRLGSSVGMRRSA